MVNSESLSDENLVKNRPVEFSQEVVNTLYKSLADDVKYYVDEDGRIWKLDSIRIVRNLL